MNAASPSRNRRRRAILIVSIFTSIIIGTAAWFLLLAPIGGANPGDQKQVAMGNRVYQANCGACHGANLEGQPNWRTRKPDGRLPAPPHDETGHTWHHPDRLLYQWILDKPPLATLMPAFRGTLTDEQVMQVLAYIKNHWLPEIKNRQNEGSVQYEAQVVEFGAE